MSSIPAAKTTHFEQASILPIRDLFIAAPKILSVGTNECYGNGTKRKSWYMYAICMQEQVYIIYG